MPETTSRISSGCVLGFDFGTRRIGVAVGDTMLRTARPVATVKVSAQGPDWPAITEIFATWQPVAVVVGEPQHADGAEHPLHPAITRFCRQLNGRFAVPVECIDERLSSFAADDSDAMGIDAAAAAVILDTWFTTHATKTT